MYNHATISHFFLCNDLNVDLWPWPSTRSRTWDIFAARCGHSDDLLLAEVQGQRSTFKSYHRKNISLLSNTVEKQLQEETSLSQIESSRQSRQSRQSGPASTRPPAQASAPIEPVVTYRPIPNSHSTHNYEEEKFSPAKPAFNGGNRSGIGLISSADIEK